MKNSKNNTVNSTLSHAVWSIYLLFTLMVGISSKAGAATYYGKNSTDPTVLANWGTVSGGTGPAPSSFTSSVNTFIIETGTTMTATANWTIGRSGNVCKLQINNLGTLNMSTFTLILASSSFDNSNGGTYSGSGSISISGTQNVSIIGPISGGAVTLNKTSGTATISANITATTIAFSGGTYILSGTNNISGTKTLSSGTLRINSANALSGSGAITISGGTLDNTSGTAKTLSANNPITIGANLNFTGTNDLDLGTGDITLSAAPTITVTSNTLKLGGKIASSYDLTKAGAGTLRFGSNPVTFNDIHLDAGTLISTSDTLTLSGGSFQNNGTFTHNSGTVKFSGSGQDVSSGTSVPIYYNLILSGSGATTMTDIDRMDHNFIMRGSVTATVLFNGGTAGVAGDVNISGGAKMTVSNTSMIGGNLIIGTGSQAIQTTSYTDVKGGLSLGGTVKSSGLYGGTGAGSGINKDGNYFGTLTSGWFIIGSSALPVKLIAFNGTRTAANSQLNFVTATEINNDKFEIERSINGIDFIKVGEVKGSGNSTQLVNYTFTDHNLANYATVAIYYRMKQLDYNGDFEYSNTIKLSLNTSTVKTNAVVSPNPFTNQLQVVLPNTAEHTALSIMTLYGTQVMNLSPAAENRGIISFNTETLAAGVYILSVNQDGVISTHKIIKK